MYEKYKDKGFVIIGVPCNDFAGQEPGTAEEIKTFCTDNYNVTFPLMAKIHVKGSEQHPLYAALTSKDAGIPGPTGDIDWNFAEIRDWAGWQADQAVRQQGATGGAGPGSNGGDGAGREVKAGNQTSCHGREAC